MRGISKYCILDSDYHTRSQIDGRLADAEKKDIRLEFGVKRNWRTICWFLPR